MTDGLYFSVGQDQKGNEIGYGKTVEGYWCNLYDEITVPDDIMRAHFLGFLSDNCACVLPEHSCAYCREVSRLKRSVEIVYDEMPY